MAYACSMSVSRADRGELLLEVDEEEYGGAEVADGDEHAAERVGCGEDAQRAHRFIAFMHRVDLGCVGDQGGAADAGIEDGCTVGVTFGAASGAQRLLRAADVMGERPIVGI